MQEKKSWYIYLFLYQTFSMEQLCLKMYEEKKLAF